MAETNRGNASSKAQRRRPRARQETPPPVRSAAAVADVPSSALRAAASRSGGRTTRGKAAASPARKKASGPSTKTAPRGKRAAPPAAEPVVESVAFVTEATGPAVLTEEERIESAKYLPRELPPRLFEEERFLFPETYGVNRLRLLVKDPEWLFAHWDVDRGYFASLQESLGQRAAALSRLTLKVADPRNGGTSVVLLPFGARSWYVRTDTAGRSYRAELGVTLPSGEFRLLAESNTVTAPRVGASSARVTRRVHYATGWLLSQEPWVSAAASGSPGEDPGPWHPVPQGDDVVGSPAGGKKPRRAASGKASSEHGGASETYRR